MCESSADIHMTWTLPLGTQFEVSYICDGWVIYETKMIHDTLARSILFLSTLTRFKEMKTLSRYQGNWLMVMNYDTNRDIATGMLCSNFPWRCQFISKSLLFLVMNYFGIFIFINNLNIGVFKIFVRCVTWSEVQKWIAGTNVGYVYEIECSFGVTFNLRERDWSSQAANHKSQWCIDFISGYQRMTLCNNQQLKHGW